MLDPPSQEYQVHAIDTLPIPDEDMHQALPWRVKDLLSFPLQEATIDYYTIPPHGHAQQRKITHVVASRTSLLLEIRALLGAAGLVAESIDIQELALKNIVHKAEPSARVVAFLYLEKERGELQINRDNHLLFHRSLEFGLGDPDTVVNNVQRSFDYCTTQITLVSPSRLLWLSPSSSSSPLEQRLVEFIPCEVERLDLSQYFHFEHPLTTEQEISCLPALGGLLRWEAYETTKR